MSKDYSLTVRKLFEIIIPQKNQYPLGAGHKLNKLETFRKRLYVQFMCCVQGEALVNSSKFTVDVFKYLLKKSLEKICNLCAVLIIR